MPGRILTYGGLFAVLLLLHSTVPVIARSGDTGKHTDTLLAFGDVTFAGDLGLDENALREEMRLRRGQPFAESLLTQDIERLLALYDRNGYPFAVIRIVDLQLGATDSSAAIPAVSAANPVGGTNDNEHKSDTVYVDIILDIENGGLFRIEEFTVQGNDLTDKDVIVRETRIDRGELYDAEKVADIRRRLERLEYFRSVGEPRLYRRDGRGGLLLQVTEGNTNLFDGVVGYQPPAGEDPNGYFTGLVNLRFGNLFGTGRRLDARWERATRKISELQLRYLEPWIFGLPLNITGGFFQRQQDSAYVRRTLDGEIRYLAGADLQFAATVQSTQVIPSQNSTITGLTRSSILTGGIELRIDTRDDVWNPRSGIFLRNAYSGGDKRFTNAAGEEITDFLQRIEVDAGYHQELLARTVLAVVLHGRELTGDELDVSDLYRVGGANTLRGYREEQFTGTRFGWINTELRYSLGRRTFAFIFYDFGYIYQSPDSNRGREEFSVFRGGYGIGGRIETALGIMGVSYALGEGDGFSDGKIHFGLINAF
ncbi:MAG: BamA/TamA family outer membrane protein [Bacteroidetes bacterium]|nr:BamA/TamA family outer membrane protein [Bacteroidota bacterium]